MQSFMMEVTQEKELDKKLSNAEGILQRAAAKAGIMQHSRDLQLIETNVQTLAHYSGDVFEEQSWVVRWVVVSLHFGPACQEREEVWVMKLLGIYVAGNRSNPFKTFAGTAEVQPLQQRKLFVWLFTSFYFFLPPKFCRWRLMKISS